MFLPIFRGNINIFLPIFRGNTDIFLPIFRGNAKYFVPASKSRCLLRFILYLSALDDFQFLTLASHSALRPRYVVADGIPLFCSRNMRTCYFMPKLFFSKLIFCFCRSFFFPQEKRTKKNSPLSLSH